MALFQNIFNLTVVFMKKLFTKIAIIILIVDAHSSMLSAQTDSATGKIYFMASPKGNFLEIFSVFMDSKLLCELEGRHYFAYNVLEGRHFIGTHKEIDTSHDITINVETGKSYYIQFDKLTETYAPGYRTSTYVTQLIPTDLAAMILPSLKKDVICTEKHANKH
jgi:hypothetical protein